MVELVGLLEGLRGLIDVPTLFGDIAKNPGLTIDGFTIITSIVLHPILGLAAFGFALTRRLRTAIAALGTAIFAGWASDMPSVFRHGLEVSLDDSTFVVALMAFKIFVAPLAAAGAISASWSNRHLAAATVAVALPTLVHAAGVAAFAIAVSLYGF